MTKLISIFLPIYNEEKILEKNIKKISKELNRIENNFEIFIIDDGSTDNGPRIAQEISKNNPYIKYIRFNNGPSRRENLALSFKEAKDDIILFMDIDLATDLKHLKQLINEIKKGADVAIGSRCMEIVAQREFYRRIISNLYNNFLKLIFKSKIKDHQCGFKAFNKKVILDLIDEMGYDKTFTRGWFWDAEMLIRAQRKGLKIEEFPVKWKRGEKTSFNFLREIKVIPFIFKLKRKLAKL